MAMPLTYSKEQRPQVNRYTMNLFKDYPKMKIRILSDFIEGHSVWGEKDGKPYPYRARMGDQILTKWIGVNKFSGTPNQIKHFLAAICYNYATKQIEVFECDKGIILDIFYDLEKNEDWGDLKGYDLTITKSGTGRDTRYSVLPSGKTALLPTIQKEFENNPVNLESLFTGGNPFEQKKEIDEVMDEPTLGEGDVEDVNDQIPF